MLHKRVIPCLQLSRGQLVKTLKFKERTYVGDPINAVKIFNEKEVDEIFVLDIDATKLGQGPNWDLIQELASEAFVPLAYGGGITNTCQAQRLLSLGVEKVCLNSSCFTDLGLLEGLRDNFGSQCVVASIDVKQSAEGTYEVHSYLGKPIPVRSVREWADLLVKSGAGELLVQSVDRDGTLSGAELNLVRSLAALKVPVVYAGGVRDGQDIMSAFETNNSLSGVAAGARFVFYGPHRAVLITYLTEQEQKTVQEITGW